MDVKWSELNWQPVPEATQPVWEKKASTLFYNNLFPVVIPILLLLQLQTLLCKMVFTNWLVFNSLAQFLPPPFLLPLLLMLLVLLFNFIIYKKYTTVSLVSIPLLQCILYTVYPSLLLWIVGGWRVVHNHYETVWLCCLTGWLPRNVGEQQFRRQINNSRNPTPGLCNIKVDIIYPVTVGAF